MANLAQYIPLPPLIEGQLYSPYPFPPQPDILQLQTDTANVIEGRVDINTFDEAYQTRIKDYYRFYGNRTMSNSEKVAKLTDDTMDIV